METWQVTATGPQHGVEWHVSVCTPVPLHATDKRCADSASLRTPALQLLEHMLVPARRHVFLRPLLQRLQLPIM
jgi:hypothetical protein